MTANVLQEIETSIQHAKKFVEMGTALERLQHHQDFKKIIKEGFFEQEAIRLVHMKANPDKQSVEEQEDIIKKIDSIGVLNLYFQSIFNNAELALKSIGADEEAREQILAESL